MNCKLRHLAEAKIRTDLFQADQTGRKDKNTRYFHPDIYKL